MTPLEHLAAARRLLEEAGAALERAAAAVTEGLEGPRLFVMTRDEPPESVDINGEVPGPYPFDGAEWPDTPDDQIEPLVARDIRTGRVVPLP